MLNKNFKQLTDLVNYTNIKVTHAFHREVGAEWRFNDYCHNFNRIYVVLNGEGALFNEKENIVMKPMNIYVIPANHTYSCRCDNYLEKFFIHFTVSVIPQRDLLSGIKKIITIPLKDNEPNFIREMFYGEDVKSALLLQNFIRSIVIRIIEPGANDIKKDIDAYRKYEKLYKYVEENLHADLSVAEVCSYAGFSQTYLGQKFKADTGSTIKQYITSAIMERLRYLLLVTGLSIGDIAKELHFDSESYCSKFFKKHMGVSPSEYRQLHRAVS